MAIGYLSGESARPSRENSVHYVAVEGRLTINDADVAVRAALEGVGVLYTAFGYVAIEAGRLVLLPENWRTRSAAIFRAGARWRRRCRRS
jgi:hypothetical protein